MALQIGEWQLNLNGSLGALQIDSVMNGLVHGIVLGTPCQGFWDEDSQRLVLSTTPPTAANQLWVGYLFTDTTNVLGVVGAVIFTLTGYVQFFELNIQPNIATAKRSAFGWYAQIGVD